MAFSRIFRSPLTEKIKPNILASNATGLVMFTVNWALFWFYLQWEQKRYRIQQNRYKMHTNRNWNDAIRILKYMENVYNNERFCLHSFFFVFFFRFCICNVESPMRHVKHDIEMIKKSFSKIVPWHTIVCFSNYSHLVRCGRGEGGGSSLPISTNLCMWTPRER